MDTPTGFRDFTWERELHRKKLVGSVERVFKLAGFLPMSHPSMQFLKVLTAKSGSEIKKEIFKIEGEELGLRFDHTVGLARFCGQEKGMRVPLKRYVIDTAWRNEEPQRGRYREFLQADIDIVGVKEPSADVEVVETVKSALSSVGMDTTLMVNNRSFLDAFAKKQGFEKNKQEVFRVMDKLDKIGREGVEEELSKVVDVSLVEPLFDMKLDEVSSFSEASFEDLSFLLKRTGGQFAPYIIRGFDYYTGNVFEFKDASGLTVAAGGRYDTLISLYGKDLPAVGAGIGIDRILALIGSRQEKPVAEIYVCTFEDSWDDAYGICRELRSNNIPVDINYGKRSLRKQMDYARALGYRYVLIVGKKELLKGAVRLKDFESGEEKEVQKTKLTEIFSKPPGRG